MAIYHFNVSMVSRSKGHNVIAKASYINATKMENHETGQISDYSQKGDVIYTEISLPGHAPQEFKDSQTLWNSVLEVEKSKNSQLARRGDFALPLELSKEERIELAREYIENTFVKSGMCVEWAYHDKPGNPHIDFIATTRPLKENGEWGQKEKKAYALDKNGDKIPVIDPKTGQQKIGARGRKMWKRETVQANDWNKKETLEHWRSEWANHCNKYLERHDEHHEKLDHRSYERQGIDKIPTIHEGYNARKMERQGVVSERCEENRSIKSSNNELSKLAVERTNNDLLIQIQLGYKKYQVISCIESANKIINDPTSSSNEKDMKLAKNYIITAEKNINRIYQDMNKLPAPIQDRYANDLQAIDLLKQIHETVIYENTHMKEADIKQEKEPQAIVKQEPQQEQSRFVSPGTEKQSVRKKLKEIKTDQQQEKRFDVIAHAQKMEEKLNGYMNARYKYSFATEYNIHELKQEISHEYRDKLDKLDRYKAQYDNIPRQIECKNNELDKLGAFDFKKKKALREEISSLEDYKRRCVEKMAEISRPHYAGLSQDYMKVNEFTHKSGYDETIRIFEYKANEEVKKEFAKEQLPQLEISKNFKSEFEELAKQVPDKYREVFQKTMTDFAIDFKKQVPEQYKKNGYHAWSDTLSHVINKMPLSKNQEKALELEKINSKSHGIER